MGRRETISQWLAPGKGHELPLTTPQLLCSLSPPARLELLAGLCESPCCGHLRLPAGPTAMNGHRVQVLWWSVLVLYLSEHRPRELRAVTPVPFLPEARLTGHEGIALWQDFCSGHLV